MNTPRSGKKMMTMNHAAFAHPLWSVRRKLSTNAQRITNRTRTNSENIASVQKAPRSG